METKRAMASWARVIESYTAVPEPFKNACRSLLADRSPFPYTLFAPAIGGLQSKGHEKVLCIVDDVFYIWERVGSQIVAATYPLPGISVTEVGRVLLYSWLTVSGVTVDGLTASTTVEFNTVSFPSVEPFVARLRPAAEAAAEAAWQAVRARFDYLEAVNYKFMNYARESLVRGEQVIHTVWQPKIRQPLITLGRWSLYRTRSLAHLAILTDKEVVFIGDDPRLTETRGDQHGGIWQHIPLHHIAAVSLTERVDGMLALSLTLTPGDHQLHKLFTAVNKPAVMQFQEDLEQLRRRMPPV